MLAGAGDLAILLRKVRYCGLPILWIRILPIIQKLAFEELAGEHLFDELEDLVVVRDGDVKFSVLDLTPVQLPRIDGDVGVWGFTPRCSKSSLSGELLCVGHFVPRMEVLEHGEDGDSGVANVLGL